MLKLYVTEEDAPSANACIHVDESALKHGRKQNGSTRSSNLLMYSSTLLRYTHNFRYSREAFEASTHSTILGMILSRPHRLHRPLNEQAHANLICHVFLQKNTSTILLAFIQNPGVFTAVRIRIKRTPNFIPLLRL